MSLDDIIDKFLSNGIAIIPAVPYQKNPSIEWKQYEKTPPTKEQMREWFKNWNAEKSNLAVLCGEASKNLVVLDFDNPSRFEEFFKEDKLKKGTWVVKTPHGYHVYFRSTTPIESFDIADYVEVKSTGRIVIAPPSSLKDSDKILSYGFISEASEIAEVSNLKEAIIDRCKTLGANLKDPYKDDEWLHLSFAYVGDDPPCIKKLLETKAPKGERDERALRIACYYANFRGDIEKAREKIFRWFDNVEQDPSDPFTFEEAIKKIDIARKGNYVFGCSDNFLKQYCTLCEIGEKTFIREMLNRPNLIEVIKNLLDDLIAGEEANKILLFILCLSGRVKNPKMKQLILLQGDPGGGKTTLAGNITSLFNTKIVGRFSKHALDYSDLAGYEILYLQELGSMDEEEQGVSTLKFLSADDRGYTIEISVRDPETHAWTTEMRTIPPITVVTTTTRVDIDPQFTRRAWPLSVDDSPTQTKRVEEFKVKRKLEENYVALHLLPETTDERSRRILGKLVKELQDCDVFLPYPSTIFQLLKSEHVRVRGDYDKLYSLAWFYSFLLQNQLPQVSTNPNKVIFAKPTMVPKIFKATLETLITMTSGLEKRLRSLFDGMELIDKTSNGDVIGMYERHLIAERLGKSPSTVDNYFRELQKKSNFLTKKKEGAEVQYILMKPTKEIKESLSSVNISQMWDSLSLKCLEEAKKTVSELPQPPNSEGMENYTQVSCGLVELLKNEEKELLGEKKQIETPIS